MKKIFEDILDDIDIESSEDSVINKLSADTEIIPNRQDFDYVLYLGEFISTHQLLYNSDEDFIKTINFYFKDDIDSIKEKFNIYLDSYWIDDNIYSQDQIILKYGSNLIEYMPKEDENFILKTQTLYQRIYFNFDNNLMHILHFLYIIANMRTTINRLYYRISNEELTYKDKEKQTYEGGFIDMSIFFNNHRLKNDNNKFIASNLEIENFSNAIIEFFYEKKKLLKLDNFEKYDQKIYVIKAIENFIQRLNKKINQRRPTHREPGAPSKPIIYITQK